LLREELDLARDDERAQLKLIRSIMRRDEIDRSESVADLRAEEPQQSRDVGSVSRIVPAARSPCSSNPYSSNVQPPVFPRRRAGRRYAALFGLAQKTVSSSDTSDATIGKWSAHAFLREDRSRTSVNATTQSAPLE
jgi:hypothetical protein